MSVASLPGWNIHDPQFLQRYMYDLNTVKNLTELRGFAKRWMPIWALGEDWKSDVAKTVDMKIRQGNYGNRAMDCIRQMRRSQPCAHTKDDYICVGTAFVMPFTLANALKESKKWLMRRNFTPEGEEKRELMTVAEAMHFLYCTGSNQHCKEHCW